MYDEFDDDRSVMYIGPRAFVAAFGALCLTLLGVTYGAARITESMDDGAASPLTVLLPRNAPAAVATPTAATAARPVPSLPAHHAAVARKAITGAQRAIPERPRAAAPARRLSAGAIAAPAPLAKAAALAAPKPPAASAPPRPKAIAAKPRSEGLLVTLGSTTAPSEPAALAPHAAGASLVISNGSHGLQPRPDVTVAPIR